MMPIIVLLPVAEKWYVAAVVTLGAWLNASPQDKGSWPSVSSRKPPVDDVPLNCDWNVFGSPTLAVHELLTAQGWTLSQIVNTPSVSAEFEIADVIPGLCAIRL